MINNNTLVGELAQSLFDRFDGMVLTEADALAIASYTINKLNYRKVEYTTNRVFNEVRKSVCNKMVKNDMLYSEAIEQSFKEAEDKYVNRGESIDGSVGYV